MIGRLTIATALLLGGCGADEAPERASAVELEPIESFESPHWVGKPTPNDPVVATVDGARITLSMLRTQLERADKGADPRAVLEKMIEFELLARRAKEAGHHTEEVAGEAVRKAMARRYMEVTFREELPPSAMPQDAVDEIYKKIKSRYDHYERFLVADAQIHCCTADSHEACYQDDFPMDVQARVPHVESCFAAHERAVHELHASLSDRIESKKMFKAHVEALALDTPNPDLRAQYRTVLRVQLYDFQYDVDRTYKEQFERPKYRVLVEKVMEGVKKAWIDNGRRTPVLTPPILTQYGYHIILIYEVHPEKHQASDHPEVKKEIQTRMYDKWRQVVFKKAMEDLCKRMACRMNVDGLRPLQKLEEARR